MLTLFSHVCYFVFSNISKPFSLFFFFTDYFCFIFVYLLLFFYYYSVCPSLKDQYFRWLCHVFKLWLLFYEVAFHFQFDKLSTKPPTRFNISIFLLLFFFFCNFSFFFFLSCCDQLNYSSYSLICFVYTMRLTVVIIYAQKHNSTNLLTCCCCN